MTSRRKSTAAKRSAAPARTTPIPAGPANAPLNDVWRDWLVVALVALGASFAGIINDYALDDIALVQTNARMHSLSHWLDILTRPYWPPPYQQDLYRPVVSLLLAAEYTLGNGAPIVLRVVSYALYAGVALALFALASRLFSRRVALVVAALFAAHPVHVEAVALGVNQAELIVGLIAVAMVIRYVDARRAGRLTAGDWTVLTLLYAGAALTKENGFILPGLLLAAECCVIDGPPVRERVGKLWRGYGAMALTGLALLGIRAAVLSGDMVGAFTSEALVGLGVGGRLLTMLKVVPVWLRLLAWPAHLQVDYGPDEMVASTSFGAGEALGLALVVGVVALAVAARRRAPLISFGVAWFAVAIVPVSNVLVPTSIVLAERTLFLPSIGFLFAAAAAAVVAARWLQHRFAMRQESLREAIGFACLALVLLGLLRSAARERVWMNPVRLWAASAVDAPRSIRVRKAHEDAVADLTADFTARIAASPTPWRERFLMARLLRAMGEDSAAVTQLRRSLAERPDQPDVAAALTELGAGGATAVQRPQAARDSSPERRPR